jgi:hypothetical protein
MKQDKPQHPLARKPIVYTAPGSDAVRVQRDRHYGRTDLGALSMDIYRPPGAEGARLPAVILVAGYPDPGLTQVFGCAFKEMGSSVSWATAIVATGIAAITYTNREPIADLNALLQHLGRECETLGIDADALGVWASSGNVPLALSR